MTSRTSPRPLTRLARLRSRLGARGPHHEERIARLEAQVASLMESVDENRRLNERLADVLDVIGELLLPAVDRDDARVDRALAKLLEDQRRAVNPPAPEAERAQPLER